ncbi:MAG TPA: AI-2E family transporter [Solimonas sp.]|nr:AI-2E family transporter [Solimonas sp.]
MRTWALVGLFVLAALTALAFARDVVLPVVMAFVLSLVFAPVVRGLRRVHVPQALGAGVVVLGLVGAAATGVANLADPAGDWLTKAPQYVREVIPKLRRLSQPVQEVKKATEQVARMSTEIAGTKQPVQEVTVRAPSMESTIIDGLQNFAFATISMLVLLYYFLASGDLFLRKIVEVTPRLSDKKRAVDISRQIESEVSSYLFTVTVINVLLGCAVALAMYAMHVPNPVLWGVMVGTFNFIPYLGDIGSFAVLTVVGLLSFHDLGRALMVPGVFYILTATEGYLITPRVLGHRLDLNPVVIVLSVLFWGWMWGILGAILAVPVLVAIKVFCDRVEPLQGFGEFLAG